MGKKVGRRVRLQLFKLSSRLLSRKGKGGGEGERERTIKYVLNSEHRVGSKGQCRTASWQELFQTFLLGLITSSLSPGLWLLVVKQLSLLRGTLHNKVERNKNEVKTSYLALPRSVLSADHDTHRKVNFSTILSYTLISNYVRLAVKSSRRSTTCVQYHKKSPTDTIAQLNPKLQC